jgi:hypothetical protein
MSDKTIKLFGLFLLFNVVMICAFNLLPKFSRLNSQNNPQRDGRIPEIRKPAAESTDIQKSYSKRKPVVIFQPKQPLPEIGDQILNSAANEDDALDKLRGWARNDPEAALIWGQGQTNNAERNEVLADACFQIAQTDPERAVMLAEKFQLSNDAVLNNLAQQWAEKDLATAQSWITSQPSGDQHDALATGLAFTWSQTEPAGAAQFITQQITPGPAQNEAAMMVLHQWALTDLTAASAWARQFPDGSLRDRALNELLGIERYKHDMARQLN